MPSKSVVKRLTIQAPPGSDEAIRAGCNCPILDNAHGKGAWGTWNKPKSEKVFWINDNCPLHGAKVETDIDGLEATEGTAGYTDSK